MFGINELYQTCMATINLFVKSIKFSVQRGVDLEAMVVVGDIQSGVSRVITLMK